MKMFKKAISVLLIAVMVLCSAPLSEFVGLELPDLFGLNAEASVFNGFCGSYNQWSADTDTGYLDISGWGGFSGDMPDYDNYSSTPWYNYRSYIKFVRVYSTSIGKNAFGNLDNVQIVSVGNSVKTIGDYAFYDCDKLELVTLGNGVTSIGDCAFMECSYLDEIIIPENVETIGKSAFESTPLFEIIIPDGVTSIGYRAFYNCGYLNNAEISDSVTLIGDNAFYDCISLETVTIGNGVETIGYNAFFDCVNISDVYYNGTEEEWNAIFIDEGNDALLNANIHYSGPETSGTCGAEGSSIEWSLNTSTGFLYITGYGTMQDWSLSEPAPWYPLRSYIQHVVVDDTINNIGSYAFYDCTNIMTAWLGEKTAEIGEYSLSNCDSLTGVRITDNMKKIGPYAFADCDNFKSIKISASVTSIGDLAFIYCPNLESITVDENNQNYSSDEFGVLFNKDKTILIQYPTGNTRTSYTIGESVTTIDRFSFNSCPYLTDVVISESVTTIDKFAFYRNSGLKNITIGSNVNMIHMYGFSECTGLTEIYIPEGVKYIDAGAFIGCSNLEYVHIPISVISNGSNILAQTPAYICSTTEDCYAKEYADEYGYEFRLCTDHGREDELIGGTCGKNLTWTFNETTGELVICGTGDMSYNIPPWQEYKSLIKSVIMPEGLTNIGYSAFKDCTGLTSVIIPDSVKTIGSSSFANCSNLTDISIPDGVTSIGHSAFSYCSGLTSITIPDSVTSIGDAAFSYCSGLASVTIPDSVTSIGDYMFFYCGSLTSVTIPDSVTSISDAAFFYCGSLTNVTIPDSVTSIGDNAFAFCSGLTIVTIPDSVTSIGDYAFSYCSGLTSITIPDSVTSIGDNTFAYCSGLTSLTIPDSVTNIGDYAFSYCSGLTSLTIPDSVTSIGNNAFSGCSGLTSVTIPDSVTSIGDYTFFGCSGLTNVTIPNSVTSIGDYAFLGCSGLTSVTIPDCVTSIGNNAFLGCTGLTSITIPDSVTSIGELAFKFCSNITAIRIGKGTQLIKENTFSSCNKIETVYYPGTSDEWSKIEILDGNDVLEKCIIIFECDSENPNFGKGTLESGHEWIINSYNELIISGEGEMTDFNDSSSAPWNDMNISIDSIRIDNSVTDIGDNAFSGLTNVDKIYYDGNAEKWENISIGEGNDILSDTEVIFSEYKITWIIDEEEMVDYIAVGSETAVPDAPEKTGYTFIGWTPEIPDVMPANDLTFLAVFTVNSYEAVFNANNGKFANDGATITVITDFNSEIIAPENPERAGYDFAGWDSDPGVMDDINGKTFNAIWTARNDIKYTVETYTMNVNGEYEKSEKTLYGTTDEIAEIIPNVPNGFTINTEKSVLSDVVSADGSLVLKVYLDRNKQSIEINGKPGEYLEGEEIPEPEKPTPPEGYEQDGWVDENGNKVEFPLIADQNTPSEINPNFVKKSYTVTWVADDTETKETYKFGDTIVRPADPVKQGYVFAGWTPEVPERQGSSDATYTAVWTNATDTAYTVETYTMNVNGRYEKSEKTLYGTTSEVVTVTPEVPDGFVLNTEKSTLSGVVSADGSLVLKVYLNRNKKIIEINGKPGEYLEGEEIPEPEKPAPPEGYEQDGWVDENGNKVEFPLIADQNTPSEINPNFVKKSYTVTWAVDSDETTMKVMYQEKIVKPCNPEKTGFRFMGWTPDVPDVMPANDLVFIAVFVKSYICPDCGNEILGEDAIGEHITTEARMKASVKIKNNYGSNTIKYGETLQLTATVTDKPADVKIYWYVDGVKKGEGETFFISFESGTKNVEVKLVDSNGNVLKNASGNEISDFENVTVKAGFFQKIISFLKNLFCMNRTVIQTIFKGVI